MRIRGIRSSRRAALAAVFFVVLAVAYWRSRGGPDTVHSARPQDPNVLWSIGTTDNSGDEFGGRGGGSLVYDVKSAVPKDWRRTQSSAERDAPVYTVAFALERVPDSGLRLAIDGFSIAPPWAVQVTANGKRGVFRVLPSAPSEDIDERQSNEATHSRQFIRIPLSPSFLRQGRNEIGISFLGGRGTFLYDALRLEKASAAEPLSATVEPTIWYHRRGERLVEVVEVVIRHQRPVKRAAVKLKIGNATVSREVQGDGADFGELVLKLEVPARSGVAPYSLAASVDGETISSAGEFRPEKRWRIFAGLKIHNDIGYTDLQQNVEELDTRNIDGLIGIISRFPFYKFNLETSWLVENYLKSRNSVRGRQLLALAARNQVGVNAMYLNVMSGLCTGEEMYRTLYYSKALQKQYGIPLKFACLTDAPSHTWFVPSLLADAGVPGFANGSNQTRAPLLQNSRLNEDSPFYWEGPDGRRVMTWFSRTYSQLQRIVGKPASMDVLRRQVPQFLARYRRGDYPVDAVLLYGLYPDNAEIGSGEAEILKEWNETYEFPKIVAATDADYYAYLAENFAGKLPVFRGDAGAYWEDGAGSTAAETALNRDSQRLLPAGELIAAWASLFDSSVTYPAEEFREAWKNLLFYDEHTWGAYNSVEQPDRKFVTDQWEFKRAYALRAHWAAKNLFTRASNRLAQYITIDGPTLFVFNPDLWPRTDVVEIELEPEQQLIEQASGKPVATEVIAVKPGYRTLRFLAEGVPGLGYRAYAVRDAGKPAAPADTGASSNWQAESAYYRVVFDPATGAIAQLYDKDLGRDLVDPAAGYKLNELLYVTGGEESRLLQDMAYLKAANLEITGQSGARLLENVRTPLGRRIRVQARAKNIPVIETEVVLYDRLKRVDIRNRIRKDDIRAKEAVYFAFPFRVSPPQLAYQVQNTWVRPNTDQLPGACRDWFTTQNLVTARDEGVTIAWATPDAPLITLTDINRGLWLKHLDVNNGHVFSYALNNYWFTNYKASQGGDFVFRYFITSGRQLGDGELARFDAETRSPLLSYPYVGSPTVTLEPAKRRLPLSAGSLFGLDAPNAQVTAFKQAEDGNGYVLRLRETAGRKGKALLRSPMFPVGRAYTTNGVEDNLSPLPSGPEGVEIPLNPHQFTTVRLVFAAPVAGSAAARKPGASGAGGRF